MNQPDMPFHSRRFTATAVIDTPQRLAHANH